MSGIPHSKRQRFAQDSASALRMRTLLMRQRMQRARSDARRAAESAASAAEAVPSDADTAGSASESSDHDGRDPESGSGASVSDAESNNNNEQMHELEGPGPVGRVSGTPTNNNNNIGRVRDTPMNNNNNKLSRKQLERIETNSRHFSKISGQYKFAATPSAYMAWCVQFKAQLEEWEYLAQLEADPAVMDDSESADFHD